MTNTLRSLMKMLQALGWDCYLHSITDPKGNLKSVLIVNEWRREK